MKISTGKFFHLILGAFLLMPLLPGCSPSNDEQLPVDFVWDRVACEQCKMALSDRRYSAQVIDQRGRPYYFDDIGCAILWLAVQPWREQARVWVNDFKTTEWIEATKAHWIADDPKTPMGYGFAATLSPLENSLDYQTVVRLMLSGKHLANENLLKHLGTGQEQEEKGPNGSDSGVRSEP